MVKEIIWSIQAQTDRKNILSYWTHRNKSNIYSLKLDLLIRKEIEIISENPFTGKPSNFNNIRAILVRDYYIFYEITSSAILILTIWDTRQNPNKLTRKLRKF